MKVKILCRLLISAALGMALCGGAQRAWAAIATTTTTLAVTSEGSPATTVTSGSIVTLTATVTANSTPVTPGRVNFCDATAAYCTDIHLLGTAQLTSAGTAALKFVPGVGSHSYKAVFVGTNGDATSSSSASALTVTGKYPSAATIAQSGSGGNYTLTATVAGYVNETGLAAPTGTVSFLDTSNGNSVLGTAELGTGASALGWLNSQTPGTGGDPVFVVVGDFNGDGIPDLAVANASSTFAYQYIVTILLGNGDGTFTATAVSPLTEAYPISIAVADFNRDGIPDLAVADYISKALTILLGNGDGTFTATAVSPPTGNGPDSVAVGDFNGDGIPDLAVANDYDDTVTILLGNGDGTFTATATSPATGNVPVSLAVGDFNGDGKADLAVVNNNNGKAGTVTILLGNGDGTFTPVAASPATGTDPFSVAVGDFKGNGKADLAVANKNGGNAGTVTILLGNGDGTFTATAVSPATGNGPESVAVGDFNRDGIPDLAVANYNDGNAGTVTILLGNGDGTFTAAAVSPATGDGPYFVAVGDFNGGGVPDLAVTNSKDGTATILLTENRTATAKASGIAPVGAGTHLVEASYPGDGNYSSSVSGTTTITVAAATPVTLSPTSLTFNPQNIDVASAPQTVTVTNSGTANLIFSPATIGGTNASDFAKSADTCSGATVTPTKTCTVSVTFTPSATGSLSASLNFTDNAANSPQTVSLSGKGINPIVSFGVSSLTWGDQLINTTSTTVGNEKVTNIGTTALIVSTVTISGTNASDFTKSDDTCSGDTMIPNATCAVSVTFTPSATGTRSASLIFTDNASNSPQTVSLTGTGVAPVPVAGVSVPSLTFSNQNRGTTSGPQPVTLSNTGSAALTIASIAASANFGETNNCAGSVAASGSCTINVTFSPTATGTLNGTLTITDNSNGVAGSTQTVNLSGTGTGATASLSASPTFPAEPVGTTSLSQTVTLTNTGNASLTFTTIGVTGPFAIATSGTTCSTSNAVAGAATCTVAVTFTPTAAGTASGSLSFSDNAPNSPQTVALSGTGQDFTLAAASGSSTSATVAPGSPASYSLSVAGEDGFNQSVSFTCTGAPSEATCTVAPSPVTAGSSATSVTVSVTTTAPSASAPRSRHLPPVPPLSPGLRGLLMLALALAAMAWAMGRRNQPGVSRWRSTMVPLASGLLLTLALAGCGGGGSTASVTPNPGTPAGTYTLTVTGAAGSGSSALSHSMTLTLTVS